MARDNGQGVEADVPMDTETKGWFLSEHLEMIRVVGVVGISMVFPPSIPLWFFVYLYVKWGRRNDP